MVVTDKRRSSSFNPTPILMAAAILVVGGFFFWLSQQAATEAERQAEVIAAQRAAAEAEDVPDVSDAVTVEIGELSRDLSAYAGRMVRVEGIAFGGGLGQQGFFADAATPFLISAPGLVADTDNPISGRGAMTVIGIIDEGGRQAFDSWLADGTIGEGDLTMADFASHFLNAVALESPDGTLSLVGGEEQGEEGATDDPGAGG